MEPSNLTNPSSSPVPVTPKLVSALNVLQISHESWPIFLDCSMISTSPSQAKRNSLNTDSAVGRLRLAKSDQTSTQPLLPTIALTWPCTATEPPHIQVVPTGSTVVALRSSPNI